MADSKTPTRPKRAAKKGSVGERIAVKQDFTWGYSQGGAAARKKELARKIDAAIRRAVRKDREKIVRRAWEGGVHWERHMARQEKWATDAAAQLKMLVEQETGVKQI